MRHLLLQALAHESVSKRYFDSCTAARASVAVGSSKAIVEASSSTGESCAARLCPGLWPDPACWCCPLFPWSASCSGETFHLLESTACDLGGEGAVGLGGEFSQLHHLMGCSVSSLFPGLIVSLEKELTPLFEELRQVVEVS